MLVMEHIGINKLKKNKIACQSPSRSQVAPCGQTNGHTDMTKLLVAFRNTANALKMIHNISLPSFRKEFGHCISDEEGSPVHIFTNTKL